MRQRNDNGEGLGEPVRSNLLLNGECRQFTHEDNLDIKDTGGRIFFRD